MACELLRGAGMGPLSLGGNVQLANWTRERCGKGHPHCEEPGWAEPAREM